MKRGRCQPWVSPALAIATVLGIALPARSHGAVIEYRKIPAVEAIARFDSGEPMEEAQVTVYSPEDPQTPWSTGTTDQRGHFTFVPDRAGSWEIKVRQAGHGALVSVDVQPSAVGTALALGTASAGVGGRGNSLNRWVTIAAVTWGFVGTALYVLSRRSSATPIAKTSVADRLPPPDVSTGSPDHADA